MTASSRDKAIKFNEKRIADPVHGSIGLSKLELEIINTKSFLRLRNVKQLGLAYYVYPGADYSRYSHCIGVCHVTGRIIDALKKNQDYEISDEEKQLYRLAGLLHDIGHFPFSHALEKPIENFYKGGYFREKDKAEELQPVNLDLPTHLDHEEAGAQIIEHDPEIKEILKNHNVDVTKLQSIFKKGLNKGFKNIISSDLDADRIDYLLRTACHTGLPYGSLDLDYLLSQMRIDEEEKFCFSHKATRTIEHFFLARYFDYQQVSFHKTVAGLELVLKQIVTELLEGKHLHCSTGDIVKRIQDGDWYKFDDLFLLQAIQRYLQTNITDLQKLKANAILLRQPPKLVVEMQYLEQANEKELKTFDFESRKLSEMKKAWAEKFGIDESLWFIWSQKPMTLTKVGPYIPIGQEQSEERTYLENQSVCIRSDNNPISNYIQHDSSSIIKLLSDYALYGFRVFVLFPSKEEEELKRKMIMDEIKKENHELSWK